MGMPFYMYLFLFFCSDAWLPLEVIRQSNCELEADVVATDILNRLDVGGGCLSVVRQFWDRIL